MKKRIIPLRYCSFGEAIPIQITRGLAQPPSVAYLALGSSQQLLPRYFLRSREGYSASTSLSLPQSGHVSQGTSSHFNLSTLVYFLDFSKSRRQDSSR